MSAKPEQHLKVGDWWYLPQQDKLVKLSEAGEITATADLDNLCQKAMNYFILNAGRLITRDEILADVWGVRDVSDGRISRVIRVLRVALGDDSREPSYIETIPKRGFRFIAPVVEVVLSPGAELNPGQADVAAVADQQKSSKKRPAALWLKAAAFSTMVAAALLYIGWQFWYLPAQAEKTVPFARYEPISSMLGLEFNAAVSPDGKHMVYNHLLPDYETFELVLQNLENVETRVLLSQKGLLSGPTWSPDGQKIAYQQKNNDDHCAIKMMTFNAEKTAVLADEVLTPCGAKSLGGRLSWSPDGAYLVYPNTPDGLQHTVLMLYAFAGGKQEQLTTPPQTSFGDFAVRFSKKGDQLVFIRDNGGSAGQLWVMDLTSRASRLLINLSGLYPMNVDWYDNDRKIIYPTSNSTISVVDVNTGHSEVLLNTFSRASETLVSQQGKIYSTIGDYRKTNVLKVQNPLYQQNPTSEQLFQSSQSETSAEMHPLEGGPTAVLTSRSGLRQIWFYYPDGRQKQISNFSEAIIYKGMEFSADGRLLLANIGNDVWIFSDNEKPLRVNKADQVARNPSWSHDGLSVYFSVGHQGRWQIVKVNRATLEQEVFATDLDFFKESPDGRYQVMHRIADDVYQVKFQDGRVIELPRNTNDFSVQHFILRAEHLYFSLKVHDNRNDIKALHLQSGEIKETGLMMNFSLKRFAVSMDEKFIYTLQGAPGDMDIVEVKPQ